MGLVPEVDKSLSYCVEVKFCDVEEFVCNKGSSLYKKFVEGGFKVVEGIINGFVVVE